MQAATNHSRPLLEVKHLSKHFPILGGVFSRPVAHCLAVDDVTFSVNSGETFGLVGESGCGKTTVGRTILRLCEPTSGKVIFDGKDVFSLRPDELRAVRREMQIVFQDPYASLNPRMTVGDMIGEFLTIHNVAHGAEMRDRVAELLRLVGLQSSDAVRYPHEFSGGQRQRVGIARALALSPKLIVCDEPVSALDVSIQSQILNLLDELQDTLGLTYIFVAHGLHVIKHVSDRVGVMYVGKIVEIADAESLFEEPLHPYTRALISAIPVPNPEIRGERIVLEGDVPSPVNPPSGCRFHTRCPIAEAICSTEAPETREIRPNHLVACHKVG